jgi:MFS family permease
MAGMALALLPWPLFLRGTGVAGREPDGKPTAAALSTMSRVLATAEIYAACLLGFFHGLAQGGMISFVGQLYQTRFAIDAGRAAYLLSVDAAGLFAGRLFLGWITARRKIPELMILTICGTGETLAFIATIISPNYLWGLLLFFLAGAFVSGNGPSLNSYVGASFPREQSGTAFALFIGISSIGGALGPYIIGVIGSRFGVAAGIWFMPLFAAAIPAFALGWLLFEKSRARRKTRHDELVPRQKVL